MTSLPTLPSHLIPTCISPTPRGLPFQAYGFGQFRDYSPWSLLVSCPEKMTPTRGYAKATGYDLRSPVKIGIPARGSTVIDTQCKVVLPSGHYGKIEGGSELALKHDVVAFGGVIDEDYSGAIHVKLFNHSDTLYVVGNGDRIAQLVIQAYVNLNVHRVPAGFVSSGQ